MTKSEFTYLLEHPGEISREQVSDFRSVISKFPYFQPARALYLKSLKVNDSFLYNQELKTTAAYTTDRSVLFDFITSEEFAQNEISDLIQHNLDYLKTIEINDYEELSSGSGKQPVEQLNHPSEEKLLKPKQDFSHVASGIEEQVDEPEKKLQIGRPLDFDKSEKHSFTEWLKLASFKPIIREDTETRDESDDEKSAKTDEKRHVKQDLIDRFIENQPVMPPVQNISSQVDLAKANIMNPDTLMTETLARIYLEQGNFEKAKQAYRILSLKYPEKSSFFADQIQAIKDLENK